MRTVEPPVRRRNDVDDLIFGTRNKRGDWAPNERVEIAPFWSWPLQLGKILHWFPEYIWPRNAFYMATALAYWYFIVPDVETMKTLSWGWALWLYTVNAAAIFLMYGSIELFFLCQTRPSKSAQVQCQIPI
jgi:hypothetical protein